MNNNPVDVRRRVFDENIIRLQACPMKPNGDVKI